MTVSLPPPQDDGLYCQEVGPWSEDKHRLVLLYDRLFSTAMKGKWQTRVYIDLYSGPGLVRVRDARKFSWGSPVLALSVPDPFDKYIFCESNEEALAALRSRVEKLFPNADVSYIAGDCNSKVDEICRAIPQHSMEHRVLSFCFADPYDLSIKFSTVRRLADRFVDFLTLLAFGMDAARNWQLYLDPASKKVDAFLGFSDWRDRWAEEQTKGKVKFPQFLAQSYATQMELLNYLSVEFHQMKCIRSDVNNLPLYHLALFSRHKLAYTLWEQVLKYSTDQGVMDFERREG